MDLFVFRDDGFQLVDFPVAEKFFLILEGGLENRHQGGQSFPGNLDDVLGLVVWAGILDPAGSFKFLAGLLLGALAGGLLHQHLLVELVVQDGVVVIPQLVKCQLVVLVIAGQLHHQRDNGGPHGAGGQGKDQIIETGSPGNHGHGCAQNHNDDPGKNRAGNQGGFGVKGKAQKRQGLMDAVPALHKSSSVWLAGDGPGEAIIAHQRPPGEGRAAAGRAKRQGEAQDCFPGAGAEEMRNLYFDVEFWGQNGCT